MSTELQILLAVAALLVALTLGIAITLVVRLVRTRRALRGAGLPVENRWVFWAAVGYLVLPVDLLPDPVFVDDIGVLMLALRSLRRGGERAAAERAPRPASLRSRSWSRTR
ncbi:YkvA family protein [Streptomyces sp. NPDC002018]|uniref:YkvA family protein n=1 Tax=Streptomyces sp. NPDC002018 TaxID=3364629 RepID=UPI0036B85C39